MLRVSLAAWRAADAAERGRMAAKVDAAGVDPGVLVVTDHGIDPALQQAMSATTRAFFALPPAAKAARRDPANQFVGYRGGDNHNSLGGADAKEMFHIGPTVAPTLRGFGRPGHALSVAPDVDEALASSALWPAEAPAMVETWHHWYAAMQALAADMLDLFAAALGVAPERLRAIGADNHSDLAANFYPPPPPGAPPAVRNAVHTDVTLFTALWQDGDEQGLVVHWRDGTATPVSAGRDVLIVNFGQLGEILTDDRWRAVPHEVTPASDAGGTARVTVPFFYRPAPTTFVASLADPTKGVVAGPWLDEKRPPIPVPTARPA